MEIPKQSKVGLLIIIGVGIAALVFAVVAIIVLRKYGLSIISWGTLGAFAIWIAKQVINGNARSLKEHLDGDGSVKVEAYGSGDGTSVYTEVHIINEQLKPLRVEEIFVVTTAESKKEYGLREGRVNCLCWVTNKGAGQGTYRNLQVGYQSEETLLITYLPQASVKVVVKTNKGCFINGGKEVKRLRFKMLAGWGLGRAVIELTEKLSLIKVTESVCSTEDLDKALKRVRSPYSKYKAPVIPQEEPEWMTNGKLDRAPIEEILVQLMPKNLMRVQMEIERLSHLEQLNVDKCSKLQRRLQDED